LIASILGKIVRRLLLYVGLALAGLAVIVLIIVVSNYTGIKPPERWVALAYWTLVLLIAGARVYREHWRHPELWLAMVGLLAIHLLAFVVILRSYPEWRAVWFGFTSLGELVFFRWILDAVLAHSRSRGKGTS
jgi:hypothetical protein